MDEYLHLKNTSIKDKRATSKETMAELPSLNYLDEYDADKILLREFSRTKIEKFSNKIIATFSSLQIVKELIISNSNGLLREKLVYDLRKAFDNEFIEEDTYKELTEFVNQSKIRMRAAPDIDDINYENQSLK